MSYAIVENYNTSNDDINKVNVSKLAETVLEHEQAPDGACASINFVNINQIHKLNKEYRGKDKPTDVLSFECDGVKDDFFLDNQEEFTLGDIFICPEIAKQNSIKFHSTFTHEIELLIVHGILHLCGYDHITNDEAEIMEALEDEILDTWRKQ